MAELKYTEVHRHEAYGATSLGVQILVHVGDVKLSEDEINQIRRLGDQVMKIIHTAEVKADPEKVRIGKEETAALLACFGDNQDSGFTRRLNISHTELPNGYCSQPCCILNPWLKVQTFRGPITIGWRKRVINIDWSESNIALSANDLFPSEDVTKGDKYIHAWGYEKAKAYLAVLMQS